MLFIPEEFGERQEMTRNALTDQGLDGMLLFKIEDMYWLCGFDSDGFSIFHAMFIGADGELTHVSRGADLPNLRYSSVVDDVRIWVDAEGNPKSKAIKEMLASHKVQGKRVGIQGEDCGRMNRATSVGATRRSRSRDRCRVPSLPESRTSNLSLR